jgi:hypothetical protein
VRKFLSFGEILIYRLYLTYLSGDPMVEEDLKRAETTKAKVCVLPKKIDRYLKNFLT